MEGKERRKRRWDLDDQGKEAKSPVEETAVSKAAQAAAAIAAKLTSTTESDHQPAAIAVAVEKKVDEPSLYETLGIKPDEKPKKPKIDESLKDTITKRLDINDTRHRYYLTKDTTQEMIEKEFSVKVVSLGKYYPDRRLACDREPPLCLEVSSSNVDDIDASLARLTELAEKGPPSLASSASSSLPTIDVTVEKVYLSFEPTESITSFAIRGKLLGPQGSFLKHIQTQSSCKVHLRGKGSGYLESTSDPEEKLHIYISGTKKEEVELARKLAVDLVSHVEKDLQTMDAAMSKPVGPPLMTNYPQYYPNAYYPPPQQYNPQAYPYPYGSPPSYTQMPPQQPGGYYPPQPAPPPMQNSDKEEDPLASNIPASTAYHNVPPPSIYR